MAPFGPAPEMVGNETSFSAPVSRRKRFQRLDGVDLGQLAASAPRGRARRGTAPAPRRRAGARRARRRSRSGSSPPSAARSGSVPRTGLPPAAVIERAQRVGGGGVIEPRSPRRIAPAASASRRARRVRAHRRLLEMIARAVGKLAAVDEERRPAVLRHHREGQRQRRVRDIGAADVEGPGDRVRIGQHQRVGAQLWRSRRGCARACRLALRRRTSRRAS